MENLTFFLALETRRTKALVEQDMPTIEALHAPEYQLVAPTARVFTRESYLAAIAKEPFYAGWEIADMSARISPAMAVVRYRATIRFPSGRTVPCWHTDTYENRDGSWQAVWSQATGIPQAADS